VMRFWDDTMAVWQDGVDSLDDGALDAKARKEPDEKTVGKIKCAACGFVLPPNAERCPSCGKERTRRSLIEAVPGQMVEVHGQRPTPTNVPPQFADKERVWREIVGLAIERKGGDMEAAQRFAQAQYRNLYGEFRRGSIDKTEPLIPSIAVRNKVMSQIIAWAKSQKFKATA
jgi:DNA repair protein RadD